MNGFGALRLIVWVILAAPWLGAVPPAAGAIIHVPGDCPTLADAISAANGQNDGGRTCRLTGSGADTIELDADVTLTAASAVAGDDGVAGLPVITSAITINGNGHTVQRDPSLFLGSDPCSGGGAKFGIFAVAHSGHLTLKAVIVKNGCSTSDVTGSGGLSNDAGTVTISKSTFTRNASRAGIARGGALNNSGGAMTISNSTFAQNSVSGSGSNADAEGGGLYTSGGTVTITNSTFAQNAARGSLAAGGGISNAGGAVTITSSTLAENSAGADGSGGGAAISNNGGTVTMTHTLLAANTVNEALQNCQGSPGVTSSGHNLATDATCFSADEAIADQVVADAGLDAFADDGTPGNGHYPLRPTSAAIDAGDDTVCVGDLASDQLGTLRVDTPNVGTPGTACDVGAIEFQSPGTAPLSLTLPGDMEATSAAGAAVTYTASAGRVDTTPPTVTFRTPRPAPNTDGWNNTDVSVSFVVRDAGSGIDVANSTASPLVLSAEGPGVTGTVTVTDRAGNRTSATSPAVKIDKTAPAISVTTPAAGAVYVLGQSVVASYSCSDGLSGLSACAGLVESGRPIDTTALGPKSFTVTATDKAGNVGTRTVNYSVDVPPGAEQIHPGAPAWVLGHRTGSGACESQFSHVLVNYAQCELQCERNAPTPCGTRCETQFQQAVNRLSECPSCLSAAAMDAARRQYADAAARWNAIIYARRPAPGKPACEGRWSQALDGLLWNTNTDHLQRVIGEIKTSADVLRNEARELATYAAQMNRLSSCPSAGTKSEAIQLGATVQAFLDVSSPLPFCELPSAARR